MRNTYILFALLLTVFMADCKKEKVPVNNNCPENYDQAEILGQDFRKCACCGGWFLKIGQDTLRTDISAEQVQAHIDGKPLPIPVCIKWTKPQGLCMPDQIIASDIQF